LERVQLRLLLQGVKKKSLKNVRNSKIGIIGRRTGLQAKGNIINKDSDDMDNLSEYWHNFDESNNDMELDDSVNNSEIDARMFYSTDDTNTGIEAGAYLKHIDNKIAQENLESGPESSGEQPEPDSTKRSRRAVVKTPAPAKSSNTRIRKTPAPKKGSSKKATSSNTPAPVMKKKN